MPTSKKTTKKMPKKQTGGNIMQSIQDLAVPFSLLLANKGVGMAQSALSKSKPKSTTSPKPKSKKQSGGGPNCATLRGGACNCSGTGYKTSGGKKVMRGGNAGYDTMIDSMLTKANELADKFGSMK